MVSVSALNSGPLTNENAVTRLGKYFLYNIGVFYSYYSIDVAFYKYSVIISLYQFNVFQTKIYVTAYYNISAIVRLILGICF